MAETKTKKNRFVILVFLLLLSITFITINSTTGRIADPFHEGIITFFSYPQRACSYALRAVRDFTAGLSKGGRYLARNRELQLRLNVLEEMLAELQSYRRENEDLRQLLDFRERSGLEEIFKESLGAEVIGRNPLNWHRTVIIDRGERDGVRGGMAVMGAGGLVGRVLDAGYTASAVMLILDRESSISAVVERTGEHGIVAGLGGGLLEMKYLSERTEIKPGDAVRTSGLGGIFPKGLLVGRVSEIKLRDYGITVFAEITPAEDFSRLETVLVLR